MEMPRTKCIRFIRALGRVLLGVVFGITFSVAQPGRRYRTVSEWGTKRPWR
jgi:hypothetical protein